ncbi:unnamed protein product [Ectocarpus sp. 4 AP-2014]
MMACRLTGVLRRGAATVSALAIVLFLVSHFSEMSQRRPTSPGACGSPPIGGIMFSMEKVRTYAGPRMEIRTTPSSAEPSSVFPPPAAEETCDRWAVLASAHEPTDAVKQLAELGEWCVVVVGDKDGPTEYNVAGVVFLTTCDQEALPYRITDLIPWNHAGRKNIGYMYAIHHGAKVIYDVDDAHVLMRPEEGVPFSETSSAEHELSFFSRPSTGVHNPYPCFGGAGVVWPRGFPPAKIRDKSSSMCGVVMGGGGAGDQRVGVVQALADNNPDVDTLYRMTCAPGGSPLSFVEDSPPLPGSSLRLVPAWTFSPYNAKATLHFPVAFWGMLLPVTVHERVSDIWRSYFTQTLLPSAGAVVGFAPPWVTRELEDPNSYRDDFQAELPLYEQSGALVDFLLQYRHAVEDEASAQASPVSQASRIEALSVRMYEHGIVEGEDVVLTQAWLKDLQDVGYDGLEQVEHQRKAIDEQAPPQAKGSLAGRRQANKSSMLSERSGTTLPVPHVLLVIAVVSARSERRDAIRAGWSAWGDDRVELRFFTEAPAGSGPDAQATAAALEEESAVHGDLVLMDIDPGMNFALKLVWAMRWMSKHFSFDFFLRLDDDYFLCLGRLLDELDVTLAEAEHPLNIYAGHRYCEVWGRARIDEAYLLLSSALVGRVLSAPDLVCSGHAGVTAAWWFTKGNPLNRMGDVEWVHDPRLDHEGDLLLDSPKEQYADVCTTHMGVHHAYPDSIAELWEGARGKSGAGTDSLLRYVDDGACRMVREGINRPYFDLDHPQPCDAFKSDEDAMFCGHEGC